MNTVASTIAKGTFNKRAIVFANKVLPVPVSPTITTQYTCTVNDGSNSTQGNTTVTVNTPVPITATASATPSSICAGETSQLSVLASGGTGAFTYSWTSVPAGFTSSQQNPVVNPVVNTQYLVHVSDGSQSANSGTNVNVTLPPTANAGNDSTFAFATTSVPLNGTATNYAAVLWTTSGTGTFSAATSLTGNYLPSAADKTGGTVTLTLSATPQSPCASPDNNSRVIHFDGPTGIGMNVATGFLVSPNPSRGIFRITLAGSGNAETVNISDITGKIILQDNAAFAGGNTATFDLSGFSKGIYFVRIVTNGSPVVKKIVIE